MEEHERSREYRPDVGQVAHQLIRIVPSYMKSPQRDAKKKNGVPVNPNPPPLCFPFGVSPNPPRRLRSCPCVDGPQATLKERRGGLYLFAVKWPLRLVLPGHKSPERVSRYHP
jgi:hypothetical protein